MTDRITWFDLPTTDINRAINFYSAVLNCSITVEEASNGQLAVLPHEDGEIAGCLFENPDYPPSKNGPLIYLNVDGRLADAVKQTLALGGEVLRDTHAISPYGYRAIILDSEGNRIALHSYH